MVIEHVISTSRNGDTIAANLALACQGCNNYKYNKVEGLDPVDAQPVALYNLRTMLWRDHFVWNEDTTLMIGLTPVGRATVSTLRLNRNRVVNLRQVLRSTGQHPPV